MPMSLLGCRSASSEAREHDQSAERLLCCRPPEICVLGRATAVLACRRTHDPRAVILLCRPAESRGAAWREPSGGDGIPSRHRTSRTPRYCVIKQRLLPGSWGAALAACRPEPQGPGPKFADRISIHASPCESAIDNPEHCGLNRVRRRGSNRFELAVGLSAIALSIRWTGQSLRKKERKRNRRRSQHRRTGNPGRTRECRPPEPASLPFQKYT